MNFNNWKGVQKAALITVGKDKGRLTPAWKKQILLAEHSPIRKLHFTYTWKELPSWVSVHLTRHKFGIEHWVKSERTDRTGTERSGIVNHHIEANAQALINISRRRLCSKASVETRIAWRDFLEDLKEKDPAVYNVCVPECIYRGFCPEFNGCGFDKKKQYEKDLAAYRSLEVYE